MNNGAAVTAMAAVTSLGIGVDQLVSGLLAGRRGFSRPGHFDSRGLELGVVTSADNPEQKPAVSRAVRLLELLRPQLPEISGDTWLVLGTTVGEIDRIENGGDGEIDTSRELLADAGKFFGTGRGLLISAACASGSSVVAAAAELIISGRAGQVLAVGVDMLSEFVHSGFVSLGAVSSGIARPYDAGRDGLILGEGAGAVLLTCAEAARRPVGRVVGWGESCDAAHITAPDLRGRQLAAAMREALESAGVSPGEVAGVVGHGTGTRYNDEAELNALAELFSGFSVPPLFSLKANIGHTLGATGVLQAVAALELARRGVWPPQAGLLDPAPGAADFVSRLSRPIGAGVVLSLNAGFGGLNSALVVRCDGGDQ